MFLPGLSTSAEVTDLSGRGVGMDVVKTNILRMGGMISIASEQGIGTKITVTLPITLAIIRALIVTVASTNVCASDHRGARSDSVRAGGGAHHSGPRSHHAPWRDASGFATWRVSLGSAPRARRRGGSSSSARWATESWASSSTSSSGRRT